MNTLVNLVYQPRAQWTANARQVFAVAVAERFPNVKDLSDRKSEERRFQLRVNPDNKEGKVPYAALIPPDQELSGGYGGMSFVMFPADTDGAPALIGMVVGTNGLAPDEIVLSRPGHARKCAAISAWLNSRAPGSAWAKRDPVRIDLDLPRSLSSRLDPWEGCCAKYGRFIYATFAPTPAADRTEATDDLLRNALTAFIDLFFDERRIDPKKAHQPSRDLVRGAWMANILPGTTDQEVTDLLSSRKYVVVQGPPGTGKTELARRLLRERYANRGRVIQFHPGTTYESFIGGLLPRDGGALGFTFRPARGHLMDAVLEARARPDDPYLLVVDEINRADLSKVLGEAIYLFEPGQHDREVRLAYNFDEIGDFLSLPPNLHLLGTMNSADRSLAILDVAVRRRFAFLPLWPQLRVVEQLSGRILQEKFSEILATFIEYASDDSLPLVPGHAYFLGTDDEAPARLATSVKPLLEEYLAQGYVAGFADEIRAYLDRISQQHN